MTQTTSFRSNLEDAPTDASPRPTASPWWAWSFAVVVIAVWVALKGELSRFPEWDEAVFYSQSGGFEGNNAPPSTMVASRESGPAFFLGLLRLLGLGVTGTRVGVAFASTLTLFLAAWRLERHYGRWVGPLTALFFGTTWLYASYGGSFFAAVPASVLGLLVFALYLDLRVRADQVRIGLLLGLAAVVALWFRPFESGVVLIVLAVHSVSVRPRELWVERRTGVFVASATILVLFVIPWSVDSVNRYGGVSQRFSSANSQGYTLEPGVRIGPYFDLLAGTQNEASPYTEIPTWMQTPFRVIVVAVLLLGFLGTIRTWRSKDPQGVIFVLGFASIAFYLFVATILADRYLIHGLVFFCLGAAILVARALHSRYRVPAAIIIVGVFAVWFGGQAAVAGPYLEAEEINGRKVRDFGSALAVHLPEDCVGVSRFGSPMWQLATACSFERQTVLDNAFARGAALDENHESVVLVWPDWGYVENSAFDDWTRLHFTITEQQGLVVLVSGVDLDDAAITAIEELSQIE